MEVDHSFIQWFINNRVADSFVNPVYCYVKVPSPSLLTFWQGGPRQAGSWGNRRLQTAQLVRLARPEQGFFSRDNYSIAPIYLIFREKKPPVPGWHACLFIAYLLNFSRAKPATARTYKQNVQTQLVIY
jgi:hypothetical protein